MAAAACIFVEMLLEEIRAYRNLDLLASQVVEGFITGLHRSPFHGFSVEFAEHRVYNQGDPLRNVDWKLFGRTDRLYTKRYEEETNLRCRLVLDVSGSMYFPEGKHDKLHFSAIAAAAIMQLLRKQRDAFGLTTFREKIGFSSDMRSSFSHYDLLIRQLEGHLSEKPLSSGSTLVAPVLHELAERMDRRSLLVLFSDMFESGESQEEIFDALQHLRFRKHEVIVFHIVHRPQEVELDFPDRPVKFVDAESGEILKLHPSEVREVYRQRTAEWFDKLKLRCHQYRIDLHEADVSRDFSQVLLPFFVKRQRML